MHAKRRRQMPQRLRNGPVAHTLLPGRQHDLARVENFDAGSALHRRGEQSAGRGRDLNDLAAVAHRDPHDAPEPEQIFGPELARNKIEISPVFLAEPRLVPGLVSQARNVEIGAGVMLRAAQRVHAGISKPRPFSPRFGSVHDLNVGHLRAHQPKRDGDARLPGAHYKHVECGIAVGRWRGRKPRSLRMGGFGQIGTNLGFENRKSVAYAASQPPSTTITVPVVKEDASLARCSAASATSSARPNRFMACRFFEASPTGSDLAAPAEVRMKTR